MDDYAVTLMSLLKEWWTLITEVTTHILINPKYKTPRW